MTTGARDLSLAVDDLAFVQRTVDRLDKRADDLRTRFDMLLTERTNRRLGFLTILSAVFLPLTLVAGIYGMNLERMPELSLPYGYPATIVAMAAMAAGPCM